MVDNNKWRKYYKEMGKKQSDVSKKTESDLIKETLNSSVMSMLHLISGVIVILLIIDYLTGSFKLNILKYGVKRIKIYKMVPCVYSILFILKNLYSKFIVSNAIKSLVYEEDDHDVLKKRITIILTLRDLTNASLLCLEVFTEFVLYYKFVTGITFKFELAIYIASMFIIINIIISLWTLLYQHNKTLITIAKKHLDA